MTPTEPVVSVVVPCRNEAAHIDELLEAIRTQSRPVDEVVIVDGASTDGTRERVRAFAARHARPGIDLVEGPQVAIPVAVNAGIRRARGDVIVRLDAHCVPRRDYVERAIATLSGIGDGVVGGVWDIAPGADSAVARGIALAVSHPIGAGDAAYRVGGADARPRDVDTVPFGCFRKAFWERLGGFDERLETNEDYEFNYRARRSGGRVVLDPGIRSTYFARSTLRRLAAQYFRYGWWKALMLRRHPTSIRWRQLLPPLFVAGVVGLALGSVFSPPFRAPLAVVMLGYLVSLLGAALPIGGREAPWPARLSVPLAWMVVHFAWGGGLMLGLGARGRPARPPAVRD